MISLRFVSHPGPFDWACRLAQYWFWASHCEAVLPDGRLLGAMFSGGVQARDPLYDQGGYTKQIRVPLLLTADEEAKFINFLHEQVGKPYDWTAVAGFYSQRDWQEDDSWFCSELMAAALAASGAFPQQMAVKFSRITPRDLMLLTSVLAGAR